MGQELSAFEHVLALVAVFVVLGGNFCPRETCNESWYWLTRSEPRLLCSQPDS